MVSTRFIRIEAFQRNKSCGPCPQTGRCREQTVSCHTSDDFISTIYQSTSKLDHWLRRHQCTVAIKGIFALYHKRDTFFRTVLDKLLLFFCSVFQTLTKRPWRDTNACIFKILFVMWRDLESFIIYSGIKKFNIGPVYLTDGRRHYWDKLGATGAGDSIYLSTNARDKLGATSRGLDISIFHR